MTDAHRSHTGALTRQLLAITAGLLLLNTAALIDLAHRLGALWTSIRWQSAIGGSLLIGLALLALARTASSGLLAKQASRLRSIGAALGLGGGVVFVLLLPVLPLATARLAVDALAPVSMRIVLWWLLTLVGALALLGLRTGHRFLLLVAFSGVALAVAYQAAGYLPEVSTYPLSLGWSETSRFYNASLFFAPRVYGLSVPLPVLHPSRYLMQSAPFLLGDLPLWAHRLWQVLLWVGVTLGTSLALAGQFGLGSRLARAVVVGACYLFLMQGPVYYHLLPCAWIVLAGASRDRPWRTLLAVLLASAWAGISRVNWYPVPAMLAITLYILEQPLTRQRRGAVYLAWPLAYVAAGALAALASSRVYAAISGNPVTEFSSSFTSDLLWYRLFPSATYPLGVLPGIVLASAVPILLVVLWARRHRHGLHPIRWLGLVGALGALFAGGLIVSAKIGGGGNLHNLDAYLLVLLVIAMSFTFGSVSSESTEAQSTWRPSRWVLGMCLLVPVAFALAAGKPWQPRDHTAARSTVAQIRDAVAQATGAGQAVLFISERHLIAFEHLEVALEPDYEKVYLMEMAMAGNEPYLNWFEADLAAHRYGLIISERLTTSLRGSEYMFGEENDVWARRVAAPLLRHYRASAELGGIWLMVPR